MNTLQHKGTRNIAFCNFYDELNLNNFMFENNNAPIGDDLLKPFVELRNRAALENVNISTVNVVDPENVEAFVFIDMPQTNNTYFVYALEKKRAMYLIILESRHTRFQNYDKNNHKFFEKIFTYDDSIVDNKKFFKINYAFAFPKRLPVGFHTREKLCVMIAGNKKSRDPNELYSKREQAIRWFEDNHPEDFELYGTDWDKLTFPPYRIMRYLNRSNYLRYYFHRQYSSYKGKVERKQPVLKQFRFSICYENVADVPGYITEKIFDSLIAGCVPIYLGAPNIQEYLPKTCFIDMREFGSYTELYRFIKYMPKIVYEDYLSNIEEYFNSEKSFPFSIDCFVDTLLRKIVRE